MTLGRDKRVLYFACAADLDKSEHWRLGLRCRTREVPRACMLVIVVRSALHPPRLWLTTVVAIAQLGRRLVCLAALFMYSVPLKRGERCFRYSRRRRSICHVEGTADALVLNYGSLCLVEEAFGFCETERVAQPGLHSRLSVV
jgi:hypothetical protein